MCVFCKIVKKEIPSAKIWENEEFLAILDIAPVVEGMTVVLPKQHYSSRIFEMPDEPYKNLVLATKKVAELLKQKLEATRVFLVIEGLDADHAHIKLYPTKQEKPLGQLLAENYPPKTKKLEELEELARKIKQ